VGPIRKVLLVDDDPDLRRLGNLSLSRVGGWQVVLASSGSEAVGLAVDELPDVALLDVSMPGMDGRAVLRQLRADPRTAHIPVVFITAAAHPDEIRSLESAGAIGVIAKPFDTMKLPRQIAELVSASAADQAPSSSPEDALAVQRAEYTSRLRLKIAALAEAIETARTEPSQERVEAARTLAHKLRGSAGSYGLEGVSAAAGRIEEGLRSQPTAWREIDAALAELTGRSGDR
jgi:two-component system OmpR family response regulator